MPECIDGGKNYDYRFAWVRDVCYTVEAFLGVGTTEEAKSAFAWLAMTIRPHGGQFAIMYRLDGAIAVNALCNPPGS